ncbi:MAG: tetratricopeptide repeat protein [Candidatus Thermoplasmatota archaeon]
MPNEIRLTVGEKILLHLLGFEKFKEKLNVPIGVTQEGISDITKTPQGDVSRALKKVINEGLVLEKSAHVADGIRRRKVYFLTEKGSFQAKNLYKNIGDEIIKLKEEDGSLVEMKMLSALDCAEKKFNRKFFILELLNTISNGMLELESLKVAESVKEKEIAEKIGIAINAPIFGREKEIDEMKKIFDEVLIGKGRVLLITGEFGIGTTRLAYELALYAISKGAQFLYGRCFDSEFPYPYLPIREALKEYFSTVEKVDVEKEEMGFMPMGLIPLSGFEEVPIAPETIPLYIPKSETKASTHTEKYTMQNIGQGRVFETLTQIIMRMSRKKPIFILIDDLQWADTASLQLLSYIGRNIKNSNVLICMTYNPELHKEKAITDFLLKMEKEKIYRKFSLNRLDRSAVASLTNELVMHSTFVSLADFDKLTSLTMKDELPDSFIELVYKETDGNPLFIEELLKTFSFEEYKEGKIVKLKVPETVKEVILRQINKLRKDDIEVLRWSSVLGNEFEYSVLKSACDFDEKKVLASIEELVNAKLIGEKIENGNLFYFFEHPKIREVIYDSLLFAKKKYMHKKVGEFYEKFYPKELHKIAENFYLANEPKSVDYLINAGNMAMSVYANHDAIRFYSSALSIMSGKENWEIIEKLGDLYVLTGELETARANYTNAIKYSPEKMKNWLLLKIGATYEKEGKLEKALENYKKVLAEFEKAKDSIGICRTNNRIGTVYRQKFEYEKSMEYHAKSLFFAEKIDDKGEKARANHNLGSVYYATGDWKEAIECYEKALRVFKELKETVGIAIMHNNIGAAYASEGIWTNAIEHLRKSLEIKEKIGDTMGLAISTNNIASVYCNIGNLDNALEFYKEGLKILEKIGNEYGIALSYNNISIVYRDLGYIDDALEYSKKCLEFMEKIGINTGLIQAYNNIGEIYARKGEKKKALEYWGKSLEIREKISSFGTDVFDSFASVGEVYVIEELYI